MLMDGRSGARVRGGGFVLRGARRSLPFISSKCASDISAQLSLTWLGVAFALRDIVMPKCLRSSTVMALTWMSLISASVADDTKANHDVKSPRAVVNPDDGSANAPASTPQMSTLLRG